MREFVYELTSSWPPARVLGGSRAAVRGQDPRNPRKSSGPPEVRELNSGGLRLIYYLQYKRSIWLAAPPQNPPRLRAWPGPSPARARPGPKSGLNRPSKTIKIGLNGVEVAPFGPKLCQNVAPRLRIIFQALLAQKTQLKKTKKNENVENPDFSRSKPSIIYRNSR